MLTRFSIIILSVFILTGCSNPFSKLKSEIDQTVNDTKATIQNTKEDLENIKQTYDTTVDIINKADQAINSIGQ